MIAFRRGEDCRNGFEVTLNISVVAPRNFSLAWPRRDGGGAWTAAVLVALAAIALIAGLGARTTLDPIGVSAATEAPIKTTAPAAPVAGEIATAAPTRRPKLIQDPPRVRAKPARLAERVVVAMVATPVEVVPSASAAQRRAALRLTDLETKIGEAFPDAAVRVRWLDGTLVLTGDLATPAEVGALEALAKAAFPADRLLNLVRAGTLEQTVVTIKIVRLSGSNDGTAEVRQGRLTDLTSALDARAARGEASTLLSSRLSADDGRAARVGVSARQPTVTRPRGADGAIGEILDLNATDLDVAVKPLRTADGQIQLTVSIRVGAEEPAGARAPTRFSGDALLAPGEAMTITGLTPSAGPGSATSPASDATYAVLISAEPLATTEATQPS